MQRLADSLIIINNKNRVFCPDDADILLIITTLTGGFFGGLVSALIAAALSNHTLEDCQNAIVNGKTLLVLNVPIRHFDDRIALIKTLYKLDW
ncbi:MAG: hypothetical protein ABFS56_12950 [Pseudomonadota bacterium]